MIKSLKNDLTSVDNVEKQRGKKLDFTNIQTKFDNLGFKVKSSQNKLTIEFEDESHIEKLLTYLNNQ